MLIIIIRKIKKPIMISKKICLTLLSLAAVSTYALADTSNSLDMEKKLEERIVVVGTRTERAIPEIAATIDVKTAEQIEKELAQNLENLFRFTPGVSGSGSGSRFGFTGFNIRGIGGNRVLTLVDGIRVPEEFSFGPFLSARRNFIDIDSLGRAEVARGPISSLYGSDALGGVVALTTKKPEDYLGKDQNTYAGFKLAHTSADNGTAARLALAAGSQDFAGLLLYNQRTIEELENQGGVGGIGLNRERPDPQDIDNQNAVVKFSYSPGEQHSLLLSLENYDNQTDTSVLSNGGIVNFGVTTDQQDAEDERTRSRYSLSYTYKGDLTLLDSLTTTVYKQSSESEQLTTEQRSSARGNQIRLRSSRFEQDIQGAFVQLGKEFNSKSAMHFFTYGLDYYQTDNDTSRNGGTFDRATGAQLPEFLPLPTRDFPLTEVTQVAFFLQDEISLLNNRLLLSPSIRYDHYDANVRADEIYLTGNPGISPPENYSDSDLTSKFGIVYNITQIYSIYARYSEGFRAPPYDDVNVGFTNLLGGYKTISNSDLVSEESQGIEIGMRIENENNNLHLAIFKNDYENFIESLAIAPQFVTSNGVDPADNLLTFQSINRADVTIEGAELSGRYYFETGSSLLSGFSLQAAIAYASGEDDNTGEPLNSIEPITANVGVNYNSPTDRWGVSVINTLVEAKDNDDIDSQSGRLPSSGYGVVDLLAHLTISEKLRINIGVFNISDKSYIRWADTLAIGNDAPARFTQPGINGAISLRFEL